ncbi:MAG: PilW family protein, partial [Shewanella sp.]
GPSVGANAANSGKVYAATTSNQAIFFKGGGTVPPLQNSRIWEYQHHVYYIADSAAKVPELKRKTLTAAGMTNDEQLVEGIENIRILYGFDSDGDKTADSYMPVQKVTNQMWDNELLQRLVSLRVFLLVRAIEADKSYINETIYTLGDKTVAAPKDNFRRKVVSTTIVLENPVLIRN